MPELFMYVVSTAIEREKKTNQKPQTRKSVAMNGSSACSYLWWIFLLVITLQKTQSLTTFPSSLELNIQHCLLVTEH